MEWSDVLSKFVETFLVALVPILVPILAAFVLALVRQTWQKFKSTQSESNIYLLTTIAAIAVKAAEQSKLTGLVTDKKNYAVKVATDYLKSHHITIDLSLIEAAIEAAVLEEFTDFELDEIPELTQKVA
jgi:hypothetical protein